MRFSLAFLLLLVFCQAAVCETPPVSENSTLETLNRLLRCSKYYREFSAFTLEKMRERMKQKKNQKFNPKLIEYSRRVFNQHEPAFLTACKELPDYELEAAEQRLKDAKQGKIKF